jgi:hypothetical protein
MVKIIEFERKLERYEKDEMLKPRSGSVGK